MTRAPRTRHHYWVLVLAIFLIVLTDISTGDSSQVHKQYKFRIIPTVNPTPVNRGIGSLLAVETKTTPMIASSPHYESMVLPKLEILSQDAASSLAGESIDCSLLIFHNETSLASVTSKSRLLSPLVNLTQELIQVDPAVATMAKDPHLVISSSVVGGKLIISNTGPLLRDYDDVRRYGESVRRAIARAKSLAGVRRLLIAIQCPPWERMEEPVRAEFSQYVEVSALAALSELHEPLEAREARAVSSFGGGAIESIKLVIVGDKAMPLEELEYKLKLVEAIETGRRLARDISGADPERMTAIRAADTILNYFATNHSYVKVQVIEDEKVLSKEYPLLAAVARASQPVPRHAPRVVKLTYNSPDPTQVKEDLYLVGKGITFDTGGLDLKVGGAMRGMSRDKCGAAAVAGFLAVCERLRPTNINVHASLAFVRNSIGSNGYVVDEIIKSRAGIRVRIGNTDAEGRMVMTDLLTEHQEMAIQSKRAQYARLVTCATLTGHVVRAYGPYAAVLENGPARLLKLGERLKWYGQLIGDPFEVSTVRRDDYDFVRPSSNCEDVVQANSQPSTLTNRGHQYPFAFLTMASGLIPKHGLDAIPEHRLAYIHLDISGAAEESHGGGGAGGLGKTTGSPVAALTMAFLKNC